MKKDFINIYGPKHHFLDGACFLVAYKNAGAMCGYWGVCGSVTLIGAALSVINKTTPLTSNEYYKDNMEFTSLVIDKMSKIGRPRFSIYDNDKIIGYGRLIGDTICFLYIQDIMVIPEHQRNGYATEALEAAKKFVIENYVEPFLAIDNDNTASIAVAKKCGFKRIAGSATQGRYYVV